MKARPSPTLSLAELEAAARDHLAKWRFKDAIAAFKDLLKRERRREWEEQLAEAYLQRARELARKGMCQEAAIFWENHAGLLPDTAPTEEYLRWLLRAGQPTKLGQALRHLPDAVARTPQGRTLLEAVALLALDNDKWRKCLPEDHAVARQGAVIRAAIAAYAGGRDAEASEALRQISSRSPYRNVALLLKGLLAWAENPEAAQEAWDRVEPESACRDFANALRELIGPADPQVEGYFSLPAKQRAAIDKLLGFDKSRAALLRDLEQGRQAKSLRPLVETVLRYRQTFGDGLARRFCLAALPVCPEAIPLYERAFGKLPPFAQHRFKALMAEAAHDDYEACKHWRSCIKTLAAGSDPAGDPLNRAIILRHMAKLAEKPAPDVAYACLQESLELDTNDKASYLKLISLAEELEDPQESRAWLDKAIRQYPKDPEVLLLAMGSAHRRRAFKKVAGYAKTLLEIDPIHSGARRYLLEAHLGHARKQMTSGNFDKATKELAEARKLDPQRRNAALLYAEGLLHFHQLDNEGCRRLWREAWKAAGGGLAAWLEWAMSVRAAGIPLGALERLLPGLDKKHVASRTELMALPRLLAQHGTDRQRDLTEALHKIAPILKRSLKQAQLGQDDLTGLCQAAANAGQYELLTECVKAAGRPHVLPPVFTYFAALADCKGNPARLQYTQLGRLELALAKARAQRDRRTTNLIETLLVRHDESQAALPDDLPLPPELFSGDSIELIQKLLGDIPAERLEQMTPMELIRKLSGSLEDSDGDPTPPPVGKSRKKR